MNDVFDVQGKRILVTGGTRGIGRAISLQLARGGAHVIANFLVREAAAEALLREASGEGLSLEVCRADLTTARGLEQVTAAAGEGGLAGLVHCAATGVHKPVEELTLRHWDFTFALNVRAFFQLVVALLPRFRSGASIVAVSSEGAVHAYPTYAAVGASKGALEALCRHLAVELPARGIRVNVLSPGSVLTEAWDAFPDRDERMREAVKRSPLGRMTAPEEVATCAQFLCSDASAGVNGHTLVVDGGQRIRG